VWVPGWVSANTLAAMAEISISPGIVQFQFGIRISLITPSDNVMAVARGASNFLGMV